MRGRPAREARMLGRWTAGWLGLFLLVGLLRFGDLSVQWPVLLVPVLWALVSSRRRRSERSRGRPNANEHRRERPVAPVRTDTVERSFLSDRPEERRRPRGEPG